MEIWKLNSDDYTDKFDWLDTNHHEELNEYVCENYADEIMKWFDSDKEESE